jgi:hypothetical protein
MSCSQCKRLERRYQLVLKKLYSVVDGRFDTVAEKLHELFRLQDSRDEVAGALHAHKRAHTTGAYKHKAAQATGTSDAPRWIA